MGAQDVSTRDYVKQADIFADAYNYLMHDGKPELEANTLRPLDTSLYMKIFDPLDLGLQKESKTRQQNTRQNPGETDVRDRKQS